MSDGPNEQTVLKGLGSALYGLASGLIGWATSGFLQTAIGYVLAIAGAAFGLWFSLLNRRYAGVLAASALPADNDEREGYLALRRSLVEGGAVARLYAVRLNRFLAAVERFFGDEGMAGRSLFPHAFGLRTAAPLWTAPAFDRCLLLALIYPMVTIFLIWGISGHGPAEASLNLPRALVSWRRFAALGSTGFTLFFCWRFFRAEGLKALGWFAALAGAFASTFAVGGSGPFIVSIAMAIVVPFGVAGVGVGAYVVTGVVAFAASILVTDISSVDTAGVFAGCFIVAFTIIYGMCNEEWWLAVTLILFFIIMSATCLFLPYKLSSSPEWEKFGPIVLFLGHLTLINAPFDWASLGLTRALLRRGLELGGWWPMILALIDATGAALIVAMLAIAMALGVQAFDSLAVLGGGQVVLPLDRLLTGIGNRETALQPEFWWVYALLLSTLLPSLINLGIGGASLMRGLPFLPSVLLRHLPADKPVRSYERIWIPSVLAGQIVGGVILGIIVQALLFWAMIAYVMPWLGLNLLDTTRDIIALNLPGRVWHLIGIAP